MTILGPPKLGIKWGGNKIQNMSVVFESIILKLRNFAQFQGDWGLQLYVALNISL